MFNFWELKINEQIKSRSWSSVTYKITINHNKIIATQGIPRQNTEEI